VWSIGLDGGGFLWHAPPQVMSSKWTDRAIIKNALQMMDGVAVPDRHTLFAAIFAVADHR
jgi:hypothetical protein